MVARGVSELDPLLPTRRRRHRGRRGVADPTPVGGIPIVRRRVGRVGCWHRRRAVVLLAIAYYGVTLYQVHSTGRSDQARPVDAIVVMGAAQYDGRPSPQLAARLDHAARAVGSGLAQVIVVTGGNQPGDRFTEAEASANYLDRSRRARRRDPAGDRTGTARTSRSTASPTLLHDAGCSACCWSATRSTRCASG